jgi:hypothetical protein
MRDAQCAMPKWHADSPNSHPMRHAERNAQFARVLTVLSAFGIERGASGVGH